jgi:polar amino acid transport system substrate-binding protein
MPVGVLRVRRPQLAAPCWRLAIAVLALGFAAGAPARAEGPGEPLRFGWFDWYPYQYQEVRDGEPVLTGLDIELLRAIVAGAGQRIEFESRPWAGVLRGLADGTIDLTVGYRRAERDAFARYSFPYRLETEIIMVRRGQAEAWSQPDLSSLLAAMRGRFRIGVVEGYVYGPERFDAYLSDPANAAFVVESSSDRECLLKLIAGEVDGVVMDRTVAATIAWRNGWLDEVEELPLVINQDHLFVLFSKASTTQAQVDAFNQSLVRLRDEGDFSRIVLAYLHPILIAMTTESNWYFAIDVLGTVAFAVSGLVLAIRERYSVLGALVLAALPAVGGGLVRDLLVSREPVGVASNPIYVQLIVGTVFAGYLLVRVERLIARSNAAFAGLAARARRLAQHTVEFFDSLGLASFTVTGVAVAVGSDVQPLWLWGPLLAVLTAAGGGVMRDVVRGRIEESSLKVAFYPEVAVIWGFALSAFLSAEGADLTADTLLRAVVATIIGAFLTRTLAYWGGWKAPAYG